ncbi:hypothetical protein FRC03_004607 [Tulasnella sp. 419]|nr:hypothetical protein FRC03_004607 [Tulasnella sp. 419]
MNIASYSDDALLHYIFLSENGVFRNPSTSYLAEFRSDSVDYLHHRMLHQSLLVSDYFSETWNLQVIFVLEHLVMFHRSGGNWKTAFFAMFLHCITTVKVSLQWPSYFPSDKLQTIIDLASREFKHDQIDFSKFFGDGGLTKAWPGDSVSLFWSSAIKLKQEGIIAGGWKDSAFFMPDVVNLVLGHYHHVMEQGYIGVDYDALRKHLEVAVSKQQPAQSLPFTPHGNTDQATIGDLEEFPQTVASFSGDRPASMGPITRETAGLDDEIQNARLNARTIEVLQSLSHAVDDPTRPQR